MIHWNWVKLIGALYLLYLPAKHFIEHPENRPGGAKAAIKTFLGLSAFWSTVVRVELTDIVFAIDSILVAVAMSRKAWVIVTGGILGILAMRLLIGQLLGIVQRYPAIVDGAYVIVAWVGIKLMIEYFHSIGLIAWEVPRWLSITVVFVLFGMSAIYARWKDAEVGEVRGSRAVSATVRRRGRARRWAAVAASLTALVAALAAPALAWDGLPSYVQESDILAKTPGTDDGAIGAIFNPAQWGVLEKGELDFYWSDANVRPHAMDNWGLAFGQGLGMSIRHRDAFLNGEPEHVTDWQIGTGSGKRGYYSGMTFGFSGPGQGRVQSRQLSRLRQYQPPEPLSQQRDSSRASA